MIGCRNAVLSPLGSLYNKREERLGRKPLLNIACHNICKCDAQRQARPALPNSSVPNKLHKL
jgi:hypothetical protein